MLREPPALTDIPLLQEFAERVFALPEERQRRIMEAALLLLEIDSGGPGVTEKAILP